MTMHKTWLHASLKKVAVFQLCATYIHITSVSCSLFVCIPISTCFIKVDIDIQYFCVSLAAGVYVTACVYLIQQTYIADACSNIDPISNVIVAPEL